MTTYPDDFVRLNLAMGTVNIPVDELDLEWPPPERLIIDGGAIREGSVDDPPEVLMVRISYSEITDDERAGMDHVARGAEYEYEAMVRRREAEAERKRDHRRSLA